MMDPIFRLFVWRGPTSKIVARGLQFLYPPLTGSLLTCRVSQSTPSMSLSHKDALQMRYIAPGSATSISFQMKELNWKSCWWSSKPPTVTFALVSTETSTLNFQNILSLTLWNVSRVGRPITSWFILRLLGWVTAPLYLPIFVPYFNQSLSYLGVFPRRRKIKLLLTLQICRETFLA